MFVSSNADKMKNSGLLFTSHPRLRRTFPSKGKAWCAKRYFMLSLHIRKTLRLSNGNARFSILSFNISDDIYFRKNDFIPVIQNLLSCFDDKLVKNILDYIVEGLSLMDKRAEIHVDKKNNIIYDPETKDSEIVPLNVDIDDYMKKEVLPHIPDAKYFFDEDLTAKKPVVKTGAEIPFTKCFYQYKQPAASEELEAKFVKLESFVSERIKKLFGGV
jgi:type I restriction enzyme M protein